MAKSSLKKPAAIPETLEYIGVNPTGYNIDSTDNHSGWGWMNSDQVSGTFPTSVTYGILVIFKAIDNGNIIQFYINDSNFCYRQYAGSWSTWKKPT